MQTVSVGAARSLDQTALRPSVIKRIRQLDVKYIPHMQSVLAKMEICTKKGDLVKKMASVRSKNETVVIRMMYIYIKHIKMFQRLQPSVVELAVL